MKILGLLMFGICLLSFEFVNGVETKHIFPPSLQELTLNFIGKKKIEGNSDLFEKFKKILQENPGITFNVCKKNITDGVAKIAAIEWLKLSKKRHLPLELYKKENPVFGLLIDEEIIKYSLSINDLIDMGAQIALSQHIDGIWFLDLTGFSLTSLDGLQKVLNISFLQRLYIDNNKLKKIEPETFINLSALQELYLGNNQLEELEEGVFVDLPLLKCLSLQDNQLKKLIPGTFINLLALQVLSFENNQLKELVFGVFINLPALKYLFF